MSEENKVIQKKQQEGCLVWILLSHYFLNHPNWLSLVKIIILIASGKWKYIEDRLLKKEMSARLSNLSSILKENIDWF